MLKPELVIRFHTALENFSWTTLNFQITIGIIRQNLRQYMGELIKPFQGKPLVQHF